MEKMVAEMMHPHLSAINPNLFPILSLILLGLGTFFTAWFFVYEVTSNKYTRDLKKEIFVALVAAIFSGLGIIFLMGWVGIYV